MNFDKLLLMKQPQIGILIREIRLEMVLTQKEFAATLGVTFPTVNRWENGHSSPSPLALEKISNLLAQSSACVRLLNKYLSN